MNTVNTKIGQELYQKAKNIIPGGNQLLSKRPEQFLPERWPSYYKKASGCMIEDLDGNIFSDFSIMGIGTCSLGYAHPEVCRAVTEAITAGSMSTLNCYEEYSLASELIGIHDWAGGVRFTRSGGEACAVAVRIARAHAKKDVVLFSGYHGWHDWYLATNLSDPANLNKQLLPGLEPSGVPSYLTGSVTPFQEGDYEAFNKCIKTMSGSIGAVVMEVWRYSAPNLNFIKHVAETCSKHGIVLIFDEISSGFRLNVGGSHKIWGLEPDICVLGKALGNGHPIAAVIGKQNVMDAAQDSFISSSFWTERVGYVAALTTIDIFRKERVIDTIIENGSFLKKEFKKILMNYDIPVDIIGVDSVPIISFSGEKKMQLKTLFTQEMLHLGFLAGTVIYLSLAHTKYEIEQYLIAVNKVFKIIEKALKNNIDDYLHGPVCHQGFQRLTKPV